MRLRNKPKNAKIPPLVVRHLEGSSVRLFETHRAELKKTLSKQHGIYVLYRRDKLYYVGLATNLFSRIWQHTRDGHKRRWDRFSAYVTRQERQVKELESLALRILVPDGNRVSGRLKGSENLTQTLGRLILQEHAYRVGDLLGGRFAERSKRRASKSEKGAALLARITSRRRVLRGTLRGTTYTAVLLRNGRIRFGGEDFLTPLAAARAATGRPRNGWSFWHYRDDGAWRKLKELKRS